MESTKPSKVACPKFKRVLVKLSGEALLGSREYGIDPKTVDRFALELKSVLENGTELCVVIGGGNIFRGAAAEANGLDRATGDYVGMLATIMNALVLQSALERLEIDAPVVSGLSLPSVCRNYNRRECLKDLKSKKVVIFAAGSGNPFFTTDTAAALRAAEMECNAILKATKVDGVYEEDPIKNSQAKRFDCLTYHEVLSKNYQVMDAAAISIARDNKIPVIVFSLFKEGNIEKVVNQKGNYTIIVNEI
jgi:uridylate kinase